jgi:hypothetical protein
MMHRRRDCIVPTFDATTLHALHETHEVAIRTDKHPGAAVVIWLVVDDREVFVRSFRGAKGRWYRDLAAGGSATLEFAGQRLAVRAVPAADPATIERVSRAFLGKYEPSPYAQAMVKPDILTTTLRLDPS